MKNVLKKLKECSWLREEDKILVEKLFTDLENYWCIYDLDRGTNHNAIFKELYLSDDKRVLSDLADKYYIGNRTLDRYILRYNRLALKLIGKEYNKLIKYL